MPVLPAASIYACGARLTALDALSAGAQAAQQLRGRPAVSRQTELDLQVPDRDAALEPEHAVDASHVVAASLQNLLQLARLLERDPRNVAATLVHGRRTVEARGIVRGSQRVIER